MLDILGPGSPSLHRPPGLSLVPLAQVTPWRCKSAPCGHGQGLFPNCPALPLSFRLFLNQACASLGRVVGILVTHLAPGLDDRGRHLSLRLRASLWRCPEVAASFPFSRAPCLQCVKAAQGLHVETLNCYF